MDIQKSLKNRIKFLLGFLGFRYSVIPRESWGICPWQDINRILKDQSFKVNKAAIQTIFDIGANEGQCAQWMRQFYSSKAVKIYSFEPSSQAYSVLKAKSAVLDIIPVNIALSSKVEERTLYEYSGSVLNSLNPVTPVSNANNALKETLVSCDTVDNFCYKSGIQSIDILKIDTESFDLEVLKGSSQMLAEGKVRFIYFEFFNVNKYFTDAPGNFQELTKFLEAYPFRPITFYTDYVNPLHPVSHFNCLFARW